MENCYLVSTPSTVGVRESRRILGDVVLTEQGILAGRIDENGIDRADSKPQFR